MTLLLTLAFFLSGLPTAPSASTPVDENKVLTFDYDAHAPLNLRELGVERRGDVAIHDVVFAGDKREVKAYLVNPPGDGPFAGVLYVHWLGNPKTTNRSEFLDEAVALAGHQAVSLLVDAMWAEPHWFEKRTCDGDFGASISQVVDLRRSLDVLLAQRSVDAKRVGLVGHDFGAMYGALLTAVDPRVKTEVFIAGTTSFADWYLLGRQPPTAEAVERYRKQMEPLEVTRYLGKVRTSVFFQFAAKDAYVTKAHADELIAAASGPKQARVYDVDHGMESKDGAADRFRWLTKELGLSH
jgi:dienelactone hydrolase